MDHLERTSEGDAATGLVAHSLWDIARGVVVRDPTWYAMTGYAPAQDTEEVGFWAERVVPADLAHYYAQTDELGRSGQTSRRLSYRFRLSDGTFRLFGCVMRVVTRSETGNVQRMALDEFDLGGFATLPEHVAADRGADVSALPVVAAWQWVPTTGAVWWSTPVTELTSRYPDSANGGSVAALTQLFEPASAAKLASALSRAAEEEQPFDLHLTLERACGTGVPVRMTGEVSVDAQGKAAVVLGALSLFAHADRQPVLERWRNAIGFDSVGMIELDIPTGALRLAPLACRMIGLALALPQPHNEPLLGSFTARSRREFRLWLEQLRNSFEMDAKPVVVSTQDGHRLSLWPHSLTPDAGAGLAYLRVEQEALRTGERGDEFHRDPLTQVFRTSAFEPLARAELKRASGSGMQLVLIAINVDKLRSLNALFGEVEGDRLLMVLAQRIRDVLPEGLVCRRSGNGFMAICALPGDEPMDRFAARVFDALRDVQMPAARLFHVSLSAGFAQAWPAVAFEELVQASETALAAARAAGGDLWRVYNSAMGQAAARARMILGRLPGACVRGELSVVFQPLVSCADGSCVGAEALLRWTASGLGPISPAEFIPMAEDSGEILALGRWVVARAVKEFSEMKARGVGLTRISVNVSVRQLVDRDLPDFVADVCRQHGVEHSEVVLEITESTLLEESGSLMSVIEAFRDRGFKFAIDDFGTGYSNLQMLYRLDVAHIKIDRSLVTRILSDARSLGVASMIVALARTLDCSTVAEGVERVAEAALLRDMGCDAIQGYLYAKPMSLEGISEWMQSRRSKQMKSLPDAGSTLREVDA
ncbi:MAG: GGDEF and EAL domain-containing protein [Xanthomonadaceae bacterium]|nr:GGDEF and EAL domain-containing protein [Xanthomonadaceae bacterium]